LFRHFRGGAVPFKPGRDPEADQLGIEPDQQFLAQV